MRNNSKITKEQLLETVQEALSELENVEDCAWTAGNACETLADEIFDARADLKDSWDQVMQEMYDNYDVFHKASELATKLEKTLTKFKEELQRG